MKDRIVLHSDLNNFFASVSLLFNPTLRDLPVAVCGEKEERHGIVLAKNEIAKSFGVKTAEPIFEAKLKCPNLVILPPIYDKYHEYSKKVRAIYERFTDMIEPFGIDECWLDVTGSTMLFGSGEEIAHKIRKAIKNELGLTVSVGVSFNKIFAKLGSDLKKPDAVTLISRENFKDIVWPLPVEDLLFAGRKSCEKLHSCGIRTIGDLTVCDKATLNRLLGKNGVLLKEYALGNDISPVVTPKREDKPKSIGKSITGAHDYCDYDSVWREFIIFAEYICDNLREHDLYASGITVHIRTASLTVKEFSFTFKEATNSPIVLAKHGFETFKKNYSFIEPLRSIGLRAINLKTSKTAVQQDIFDEYKQTEKLEETDDSIYKLRQKFGNESIKRGRTIK